MPRKKAKSFNCPTEFTLDVLGGKWKTVILSYLKERPCRYSELRKLMPALSDKILTERLRELCERGLVIKSAHRSKSGGTYYALSRMGESLRPLLGPLYQWGVNNAEAFGVTVGEPMKRLKDA